MATDFKSIPLIVLEAPLTTNTDISPLVAKWDDPNMADDEGVADVVRQLDQACREVGLFYVKGHGIPDSLIKEARDIARSFFSLPYVEKLKIKMTSATGLRGYRRVGENKTKGITCMHEAIECCREINQGMYGSLGKPIEGCNQWPSNPTNFKNLMEVYIGLCTDLSRKTMRGIAQGLGVSPYQCEGAIAGDPFWVLRVIGYPVESEANFGCRAHTDYGFLTLNNQDDDTTALQVQNHSGEWIYVVPISGTFVCNVGNMLKILSNGIYKSTWHRVVNNTPKYRVSLPFFYDPNFDTEIEPLNACKERSGGTSKFTAVVYGKYFISKLLTNSDEKSADQEYPKG